MKLLSFIDKLYENNHFTTILTIAIILLVLLFIIVLVLGLKDAKASKEPKKIKEEDPKDITFEPETKEPQTKEDVTFEAPVLTKNLEEFKKNFEEEIQKDQEVEVRTTSHSSLSESTKPVKILDMDIIEDTAVLSPVVEEKPPVNNHHHEIEKPKKETKEKPKIEKEIIPEKISDDKLHFIDDDGL